jgi:hypothetical protein
MSAEVADPIISRSVNGSRVSMPYFHIYEEGHIFFRVAFPEWNWSIIPLRSGCVMLPCATATGFFKVADVSLVIINQF